MYRIKNMYFYEIYNFLSRYSSKFSLFTEINAKNHDFNGFFIGFTMKIKFAPIFTIIFVISASKYICLRNFKNIRGNCFLKLHPRDHEKLWTFTVVRNCKAESVLSISGYALEFMLQVCRRLFHFVSLTAHLLKYCGTYTIHTVL